MATANEIAATEDEEDEEEEDEEDESESAATTNDSINNNNNSVSVIGADAMEEEVDPEMQSVIRQEMETLRVCVRVPVRVN